MHKWNMRPGTKGSLPDESGPFYMNCLFCFKELKHHHENFDWMGFPSILYYNCDDCQVGYTNSVQTSRFPDGHISGQWDETTFYRITQKPYQVDCYMQEESCEIFTVRKNGSIYSILKFSFIPQDLTPSNMVERIKSWMVYL